MADPAPRQSDKTLVERALALVTEVRPGEAGTALILSLNVFLILTAYYIIKPVRESLVLTLDGGAELKAYAGGATALLLLIAVPAYAGLANRLPRNRLIVSVTLFFVACLVVFYGMGSQEPLRPYLAIPFYLWVAIFNMMVVAQFWAFANDVYDEERGKRLFPLVGIGASVGAAAGSGLTAALLEAIDVYSLMLVSAAILAITAALTQWVHARETRGAKHAKQTDAPAKLDEPPAESETNGPKKPTGEGGGAFAMVFSHRYLLVLAAFSLLFTFVNTNGEYMLGAIVNAAAMDDASLTTELARKNWVGQFYAVFYFGVNVLGVLLQTFVVSRLIKYGGLKVAFLVLPVLALAGATLIAVVPLLIIVRISKTLENATDYSVNNTVRNMLWLPTTREMKYKAKQAVDTFFVRMGDVSSAVAVYAGASLLGLGVRAFAITNVVLCTLWLLLAFRILRENAKMSAAAQLDTEQRASA